MTFHVKELELASDEMLNASLDPTLWRGVLERVAMATGSFGANIVAATGSLTNTILATDSLAPAMQAYRDQEWYARDYRAISTGGLHKPSVVIDRDIAGADAFSGLEYYRFLGSFGLRWAAILTMPAASGIMGFILQRRIEEGPFSRREAVLLQPLRRKLLFAGATMRGMSDAKHEGMSAAFERVGTACIFFDRSGLVSMLNDSARKHLGDQLQITGGRLRSTRPDESARIGDRLRDVLRDPDAGHGGAADCVPIFRQGKRPLLIEIHRVGGSLQDAFGVHAAMATLTDPEDRRRIGPEVLIKCFGLTDREAEIADLISAGISLVEIGNRLGVAHETVRTHCRAILRKTDTNSQGQLIALLGRLAT